MKSRNTTSCYENLPWPAVATLQKPSSSSQAGLFPILPLTPIRFKHALSIGLTGKPLLQCKYEPLERKPDPPENAYWLINRKTDLWTGLAGPMDQFSKIVP